MVIFMTNERNRLVELIKNNSKVIVSCSGGPDSMALLSLVNSIKDEKNIEVIVAHVNHKVREESDEEALMVEKYARDNGDIFELFEIKEYHEKANFHEDARKIRYAFLKTIKDKYNADYLLTAHHGDDLIETILMRITRGSNLKGYIGFKEVSSWEGITLIRPLIKKTKSDLEKYDQDNNIPYRIDKTNASLDYTRNRYRNVIIPLLKSEEENIHLKYLKLSRELNKYFEFVSNQAENAMNEIKDENGIIVVSKFNQLDSLIKENILSKLIVDYQLIDYLPLTDSLFDDMFKVLESKKDNACINLPNGYIFGKEYDKLIFKKIESYVDSIDYTLEKDYIGTDFDICFSKTYDKSNDSIALNSDDIVLPLKVRNRHDGDYMEVLNLGGKKKVSDIFIEAKIPKEKRNSYPIVTDANNIVLWIPKIKKSKFAKANNEKYDIILSCKEK